MKRTGTGLIYWACVYVGIVLVLLISVYGSKSSAPQNPVNIIVPSSLPAKLTYKAVPVPTDIEVIMRESVQEHLELVGLNNAQVDQILAAHHVELRDQSGNVVFPRP